MKKCPFCAEEIMDEAIKCKHCGEFLNKAKGKWYYTPFGLIIAFLCIGPFALPLVFLNPNFNKKTKFIITLVIIVFTIIAAIILNYSLRSIFKYYKFIFEIV